MSIRVEQEIAATRARVWEELADLANHPTWMKDAVSVEFIGSEHRGLGTRMRVPTRVGPFRTEDVLEVTRWDEGEAIGVAHDGTISGVGLFRLEGDQPTTVVWEEDLAFPWWLGGPVSELASRPVLRAIWRRNLQRLATIVED